MVTQPSPFPVVTQTVGDHTAASLEGGRTRRVGLRPADEGATVRYFDSAEEAAAAIVRAFETPNDLPTPLATLFMKCGADVPCRKWSWRNQLLVALAGYADARGFRQWQQVGRWVRKGEKAFTILAPVLKAVRDEETGKEKEVLIGFRGIPVFGLGQSDGEPLPNTNTEAERWVESLPLVEVARRWGLTVEAFDGEPGGRQGFYRRGQGIGLGVRNLSTWAHELVHAADDRAGNLAEWGQNWRSETVAQLGAAVLLRLLGQDAEADLGGSFRYLLGYALEQGMHVADACGLVLDRTCQAVRLILDTAEEIAGTAEGRRVVVV